MLLRKYFGKWHWETWIFRDHERGELTLSDLESGEGNAEDADDAEGLAERPRHPHLHIDLLNVDERKDLELISLVRERRTASLKKTWFLMLANAYQRRQDLRQAEE